MQQITFQVKTLTPLFIAGADQSGKEPSRAELRVPTFRGLMRYWYRALDGGIVGASGKGFEQVMQNEKAIFGATDVGSAVIIKISHISGEAKEFTEKTSEFVNGVRKATGKGYLLWSMARSGSRERNNEKAARWYFPPKTTFQVTLNNRSEDSTKLQQAIAAFWLLTHLGGVGSRSRRCAGSLSATVLPTSNITVPDKLRFDMPKSIPDLQTMLEDGIREAQRLAGSKGSVSRTQQQLAPFDIISPSTCRIWIVQDKDRPWDSAEDAMTTIGEDLQNYRGGINPIQRRRVFGLPLKDVDPRGRRSSPLMLRIVELQNNKYVCVAVVFKTVVDKVNAKDYDLVEKWAYEYPGSIEVKL